MSKLKKLVLKFLKLPSEVRFEDVVYLLEAFDFEEKRSRVVITVFETLKEEK
jgi:hypothetical protein